MVLVPNIVDKVLSKKMYLLFSLGKKKEKDKARSLIG